MSREQFLNDLKAALKGMKDEEIEGVLAYYGEMIDDRTEAGMSEEAAVCAMEPVDVIASRVLGEAGVGEEKGKEKENEEWQEIRRPAEEICELRILAENKRIRVVSGEGSEVVLRYCIGKNDIFRLHEDDGVLTLEHKMRPVSSFVHEKNNGAFSLNSFLNSVGKFLDGLGDRVVAESGIFNSQSASSEVEVTVPRAFRAQMRITTHNSRITASNITCAEKAAFNTSNARIVLEQVAARQIQAITTNGRIEMDGVYAREGLEAVSSNGRIVAKDAASDQELHLTTSNGRVELESILAHDLYVKTSNGGVSGTIKGSAEEYTIHSATSNAGNNLVSREGGEKTLSIVTSNGAVNVSFTEEA